MVRDLRELVGISAQRYPCRTAIVFGQKKIDYKTLNESIKCVACGLIDLGIQKGDRVALFLDNCPEFVISYFAVLEAGAIVVPVNYMFKTEEAKFILQDSESVCLITSLAYIDMAEELRLRIDSLKYIITTSKLKEYIVDFYRIKRVRADSLENSSRSPHDPAVILYTSGTTGYPKGAVLSHDNLISNAVDSSLAIGVNPKSTFICILPLFHSFAATVCMNLPLLIGAKIVIMKSLRPFKRVIRAIRKHRVSIFVAIPSIYNILKEWKFPKIFNTPFMRLFNPVRLCISGAAALPLETFYDFHKKFRIPILEGYGLTEASPVVTLNPSKKLRPGSIGVALSRRIEMKIVDDNGRPLPAEQIGELVVKGPNVMQGYYKQEIATQEALRGGWLYTGDMARLDRDNYAYIVGRKKEMINVRGLNVYPREIEEVLYQNPKVKEAAVIGIPDRHKGEVPLAFVVIKEGKEASEHEVMQYLRERLAPYKIPRSVEFRLSLPKNTTGKILKRMLQDEYKRQARG